MMVLHERLPHASKLAEASPSGSVLMWDADPTPRGRAGAVAGRTPTRQEWDELLPGRPYQAICQT